MSRFKNIPRYYRCIACCLCISIFFGGEYSIYAQTNSTILPGLFDDGIRVGYDMGGLRNFTESAENGLKMLYLILWPMLVVAAAAMDNSLVYGDAFYLTNALFKFWQITRTFANYTIGLYFVGMLLAAFFGNKLENVFSGLIKNVALAGILVNVSRWIMAALIDLSTIATFSLGGLPLYALENDAVFKENIYYMKTYSNINLNASTAQNADKAEFSMMYGCTSGEGEEAFTRYYLPCAINAQKLVYLGSEGEPVSRAQYKADFTNVRDETTIETENIDDYFCVYDNRIIENQYGADISQCIILQELMINGKEEGIAQCAAVDDIMSKSQSFTGPLFTLYSSILRATELGVTTNTGNVKEVGMTLLVKLVFGLALIIPLIALAVVMLIRVVYLWLIIAFSPLITIAIALNRGEKIGGKIDGVLSSVLKPTQIVSLIFLPVIATFGLSISIIFLSLLQNLPIIESSVGRSERSLIPEDECPNDPVTALGIQRNESAAGKTYDTGFVELNFSHAFRQTGADIGNMLSWLIINFFGIALMWMVVFAALKTNEFTKGIAETIDKTAKARMGTVPIIPIAGGIGVNTAKSMPKLIQDRVIGSKMQAQQDLLNDMASKYDGTTKAVNNEWKKAQSDPGSVSLNGKPVPERTDFRDYSEAPKALANAAKTAYVNDKGELTTKGKTYATSRGLSNEAAMSEIKSLDNINSWEKGLKNKTFVDWMHQEDNGKGYDQFLNNWDKRSTSSKKTNSVTAKMMEEGLKEISTESGTVEKNSQEQLRRYFYDNKITSFERKNNAFNYEKGPKTYLFNKDKTDLRNVTKKEIEGFNFLLGTNIEEAKNRELYKKLLEQKDVESITIEGETYKPQMNDTTFVGFVSASKETPPEKPKE